MANGGKLKTGYARKLHPYLNESVEAAAALLYDAFKDNNKQIFEVNNKRMLRDDVLRDDVSSEFWNDVARILAANFEEHLEHEAAAITPGSGHQFEQRLFVFDGIRPGSGPGSEKQPKPLEVARRIPVSNGLARRHAEQRIAEFVPR